MDLLSPEVQSEILKCVRCRTCLPVCPTFAELEVEMDSPRGRIALAKALSEGKISVTERLVGHLYCCLDCRACETVCPSGVKYGEIIESARSYVEEHWKRPKPEQFLKTLFLKEIFPYPRRLEGLAWILRLYQKSGLQTFLRKFNLTRLLPGNLGELEKMTPVLSNRSSRSTLPSIIPPKGERRYRVALLLGCITDIGFASLNEATARVLSENGCEVLTVKEQKCCGALQVHNGESKIAREMARYNLQVFESAGVDYVIVNAAGCGAMLKEYGFLLGDDSQYRERARIFSSQVRDVNEFLVDVVQANGGLRGTLNPIPKRVAYHDACHLAHGQRVRKQPRKLLQSIPALELVELKESDWCCGSAGIYNITNYNMSMRLLDRKMDNVAKTRAEILAAANPGCMIQLEVGIKKKGLAMKVMHPIELLDKAYHPEHPFL
ncbi:MAG TPA: heterodisulfide reductase-related iron-sulfur binding cluster [Candidatus Limnocylindrales bacterium]|nr:heterodisulfide reductase-related iron-sulfur binding cluster [Candidatus Limnocylindrales bacterium]